MPYVHKKASKTRPNGQGIVLFERPRYLVFWRFKTKKPPRPKRWVNLVVFLRDPLARKRSFQIGWNGSAIANSRDQVMLNEREPDLYVELFDLLPAHNARLVKPATPEGDDND